jgi:prepilin-type N-terminal cleavage/methylation domain-containing protein
MYHAPSAPPPTRSGGFSLLEVLVAVALVALLAGALVPAAIGYLESGAAHRAVADLEAVGQAARHFRVDVRRWPGSLADLVGPPAAGAADLAGHPYPATLLVRWEGPYLPSREVGDGSLATAEGARIRLLPGVGGHLVLTVEGLAPGTLARIDQVVDGAEDAAAGRLRIDSSGTEPVLLFFAATLDGSGAAPPGGGEPPPPDGEPDPDRGTPPTPPSHSDGWEAWLEWWRQWWEWWKKKGSGD